MNQSVLFSNSFPCIAECAFAGPVTREASKASACAEDEDVRLVIADVMFCYGIRDAFSPSQTWLLTLCRCRCWSLARPVDTAKSAETTAVVNALATQALL